MLKIANNSSPSTQNDVARGILTNTRFLEVAFKETTWSNFGPRPTFIPRLAGPPSIFNYLMLSKEYSQGLNHIYLTTSLSGEELRKEILPEQTPSQRIYLPTLSELYLRGSFIACGMLLNKLILPGGCRIYLSIVPDSSSKNMKDAWTTWVERYLMGYWHMIETGVGK